MTESLSLGTVVGSGVIVGVGIGVVVGFGKVPEPVSESVLVPALALVLPLAQLSALVLEPAG